MLTVRMQATSRRAWSLRRLCAHRGQPPPIAPRLEEQALEEQRNKELRIWAAEEVRAAQRVAEEEKRREKQSSRETRAWVTESSGVPSPAVEVPTQKAKSESGLRQAAKAGIITWVGVGCFTFAAAWAIAEFAPGDNRIYWLVCACIEG